MLIRKIELHNFRQFYGSQTITLATDSDKNVTLIHAENGVGKTALLNAILWCFFETFTDNFKDSNILLNNYAKSQGENAYRVTIVFEEDTNIYSVERGYNGTSGRYFRVYNVDESTNSYTLLQNPDIFLNSVIPKDMANYFFFQGEGAGTYTSKDGGRRIKEAIQRILGFTVAKSALADVNKVHREYSKALESADQGGAIGRLTKEINLLRESLINKSARLNDKKESTEHYEKEIESIDATLRRSNSANIKTLHKNRSEYEADLERAKKRKKVFEERKADNIKKYAGDVFAYDLSLQAIDFIDEGEIKTVLPAPFGPDLINKIFEESTCICGADVGLGSEAYNRIQNLLSSAKDPGQEDRVNKAQAELRSIKKISSMAKKDFAINAKDLTDIENEISKLKEKIKNVSIQLQDIGDQNDMSVIKELETRRSRAKNELNNENISIGRLGTEIQDIAKELQKRKTEVSRLESSSQEVERYRQLQHLASSVIKEIENTLEQTQESVETQIISKVNNFLNLFVRQDYTARLDKKDYSIRLIDRDNQKVAESDGQALLLSLTFISSLIELARDRKGAKGKILTPGAIAPFIIDAPFGVLDNKYKGDVAKSIPQSVGQVVFFLSSSHWEGTVEENIRSKVGAEYNLELHVASKSEIKSENKLEILGNEYVTAKYGCEFDQTKIVEVGTYV